MPGLELRPRLASEIVDGAFQLYRRHFTALVTLSAVIFGPYAILQLLLIGGGDVPVGLTEAAILAVLTWVFGSIADAAVVVSVSSCYLNDTPDAAGALRQTFARLGTVLLAVIAKWLIIAAGMAGAMIAVSILSAIAVTATASAAPTPTLVLGLIVTVVMVLSSLPLALFFWARYFAVPATVMLEGTGVRQSLRRSKALARGFKGKVLGALGLSALVLLVMQMTLAEVFRHVPGPAAVGFLLGEGVTIVAYPLLSVIATLLYYDARIRKEGFDIAMMAAELGAPPAPAPQSPPA